MTTPSCHVANSRWRDLLMALLIAALLTAIFAYQQDATVKKDRDNAIFNQQARHFGAVPALRPGGGQHLGCSWWRSIRGPALHHPVRSAQRALLL